MPSNCTYSPSSAINRTCHFIILFLVGFFAFCILPAVPYIHQPKALSHRKGFHPVVPGWHQGSGSFLLRSWLHLTWWKQWSEVDFIYCTGGGDTKKQLDIAGGMGIINNAKTKEERKMDSDFAQVIVALMIAVVILVCGIFIGLAAAASNVASITQDCQNFNAFVVDEVKYICEHAQ